MQNNLSKAQDMLMLLSKVATGEDMNLHSDSYVSLRLALISNNETKVLLPSFIKSCRMINDFWDYIQPLYGTYKERRNYLREQFDPLLTALEEGMISSHLVAIGDSIQELSCEHANYLWHKALIRAESDADGAITAARSLIESVCKQILVDRNVDYDEGMELPKLFKLTARKLNLAPDNHNDEVLKQILKGIQTTIHGFSSLRNKLSDAHGQPNGYYRAHKRHAEFAINLASSTALFLIRTHQSSTISSTAN